MKLISPDEKTPTQESCISGDTQNEDQKLTPEEQQCINEETEDSPKVMEGKPNNVNVHLRGENHIRAHDLHVDDVYKKCVIDNGADTAVVGKGWKVIEQITGKATTMGFDSKVPVKRNLPIVSAVAAVDLKEIETISVGVHESVLNESAPTIDSFQTSRQENVLTTLMPYSKGMEGNKY